jgi:hypothetical protein
MRNVIGLSTGVLLAASLFAATASAAVVAEYQTDYTTSGLPKTGWSYQWNKTGAIDFPAGPYDVLNSAALVDLVRNGTNFEASAGVNPSVTPTTMIPGKSATEDGVNSRWAIVSYTIQPSDVANGHNGTMPVYSFGVSPNSDDGILARLYVNGVRAFNIPLDSSFNQYDQNTPGAYPVPFGNLNAGDVISVAVGANGNSIGDAMTMNFQITLDNAPEPGSMMLAAGGILVLSRRRSRH